MQDKEVLAYMFGVYTTKAIGCTFGKGKFPEKPIKFINDSKHDEELTEEQIKLEREKLIMSLQIMQTNYELNHKK